MQGQIGRWGNSLAVRIPGPLAREIEVREGTPVDISVDHGRFVVTPVDKKPQYALDELLAAITEENLHGETATGRPVGEEFA